MRRRPTLMMLACSTLHRMAISKVTFPSLGSSIQQSSKTFSFLMNFTTTYGRDGVSPQPLPPAPRQLWRLHSNLTPTSPRVLGRESGNLITTVQPEGARSKSAASRKSRVDLRDLHSGRVGVMEDLGGLMARPALEVSERVFPRYPRSPQFLNRGLDVPAKKMK